MDTHLPCPMSASDILQLMKEQNGENKFFYRVHMAEVLYMASVARGTTGCELKFSILVSQYHVQKSNRLQIGFPWKVLHHCLAL